MDADAPDAYEEEEIIYAGSGEEEEEEDDDALAQDIYEAKYADQQSGLLDEKIAAVEQKKWVPHAFKDEQLSEVVALMTDNEKISMNAPKIEKLQDIRVKKRVADAWPKTNKSVKKGMGRSFHLMS